MRKPSDVSRDFLGKPISAGDLRGKAEMSPYESRGKPWWGPDSNALGSSKYLVIWNHFWLKHILHTCDETNSTYFFKKILLKFECEVNFSVQSSAFSTHENPAYLQITYLYVYYLKYTELWQYFQTAAISLDLHLSSTETSNYKIL